MTVEIQAEANVAFDKNTDEVVIGIEVDDSKSLRRRKLEEFLSIPENCVIFIDDDWRLVLDQGGKYVRTDPLEEELRYEV